MTELGAQEREQRGDEDLNSQQLCFGRSNLMKLSQGVYTNKYKWAQNKISENTKIW